ncbi:MAG: hypothetical protein WBD87_02940 [Candidatus Acidiferrales bacterium]
MTGRRYYLTTLAAWQRHAPHCAETHFVVLSAPQERGTVSPLSAPAPEERTTPDDATHVFALITADEAAHIALENDPETEPLPHPLARTAVSERVAGALAPFGVVLGDDTFTVGEKLAHLNLLLRYRVF